MSNNPTPESLAWNYKQVSQMKKDLNALKINSAEFQQGVRNVHRAINQLSQAYHKTFRWAVDTFGHSMIRTQIIRDKLPRKAKKAYIKKYGRQAYHRAFPPPKLAVLIDSPGGMIE